MTVALGETTIVVAVLMLTGLGLCYLGYRIRYLKDYHLIAGYRSEEVADADSLARLVGGGTIVIGLVTLLYGAGAIVLRAGDTYWLSYTVLVLVSAGYLSVQSRQYAAET
ncbi:MULTISPECIES: DUF3784 domain-containing protein [Haloferax]|nr:DUF3784 domain-containing protein [Haloferax mediterranei]AFK19968.1 hypothetical protein HFX_2281 [Haloferax mediterranei ATCC 33500]MDX5987281.1 DUF3784 domain-containing protein [Haloferax mediterranei ATCC 33500]